MAHGFLQLKPVAEVRRLLDRFDPVPETDRLPVQMAPGRVTASAVHTREPLPAFDRCLMDGYAVRAADVAAARETSPAFLQVIGEVSMGEAPRQEVAQGRAMAVPTGSMLPAGADSVVMVEYTRPLGADQIEVTRPVGAGENVLPAGGDLGEGASLLEAGRLVSDLDLGAMTACGVTDLDVFRRPRVAILSTGDELIDPDRRPAPGQVRDTNAWTLAAQVRSRGGEPLLAGRVGDDFSVIKSATAQAVRDADMLLLSGGSSVGVRDHTAQVLRELGGGELLIEGIAIAPGKPTLLAEIDRRPVWGMPGHPISSFIIFQVIVAPLLDRLAGLRAPRRPAVCSGELTANIPSSPGRETWVRVRLEPAGPDMKVAPVLGGSAVYASLLQCDGLVRIPAEREGFARGDVVQVELLR